MAGWMVCPSDSLNTTRRESSLFLECLCVFVSTPLAFVATRLAFFLGGGPPSLFWPTNGVNIMILNATKTPVGFFLAACASATGLALGQHHLMDIGLGYKLAAANSLESIVGSLLMRQMVDFKKLKETMCTKRFLTTTLVLPILGASILGAMAGATVLTDGYGFMTNTSFWDLFLEWFVGDLSGNYVTLYTGYVILGYSCPLHHNLVALREWFHTNEGIRDTARVLISATLLLIIFNLEISSKSLGAILLMLVFPITCLVAENSPQVASVAVDVLLVFVAVVGTRQGRGPVVEIMDAGTRDLFLTLQVSLLITVTMSGFMSVSRSSRLMANAKVVANVEEKLAFFTHVSHEFRTPLSIVLGFAEQLMAEVSLPKKAREDLEHIFIAALGMTEMVNDLLHLFRMDMKAMPLLPKAVHTSEFFAIIQSSALRLSQRKSQTLEIDTDLPAVMEFDEGRLRQVINNLLSNAVKYTPPFKSIKLCARVLCMGHVNSLESIGLPSLEITVQDTGTGISPEDCKRVFERFYRCDGTTNEVGSGLGLTICSNIVQQMGGKISVKSTLGEGTTFMVVIPAVIVPHMDKVTAPLDTESDVTKGSVEGEGQECHLHILVAEDSIPNQKLMARILEHHGHTVEVVGDGQQAIDRLSIEHYDLLVTDLGMPRKSGLDVLRWVRSSPEDLGVRDIPVIISSGHVLDEHRKACKEAGCNAFTTKPFRSSEVGATVERVHRESSRRKTSSALRDDNKENGVPR